MWKPTQFHHQNQVHDHPDRTCPALLPALPTPDCRPTPETSGLHAAAVLETLQTPDATSSNPRVQTVAAALPSTHIPDNRSEQIAAGYTRDRFDRKSIQTLVRSRS